MDVSVQTDASGAWGCAAVLNTHWLQLQWPQEWQSIGIMAKELVPIILTYVVWGPYIARQHINFCCDNASLVISIINKNSSKDKLVMYLLHTLSFFVAYFNMHLTACHLPGDNNVTPDHLSRGNQHQVSQTCPSLASQPTMIPPSAIQLISWIGLLPNFHNYSSKLCHLSTIKPIDYVLITN